MDVVDVWTGRRASALKVALRMTNESFAEHLGTAVRTVAKWEANPDTTLQTQLQDALDTVLDRASDSAKARFALLRTRNNGATASGSLASATRYASKTARPGDIARLRTDAASFGEVDHRFGGRHIAWIVTQYIDREIVPLLPSNGENRDFLTIASVLARKAAMAKQDSDDMGEAQYYFDLAIGWGQQAGNRSVTAHAMISMAHRAVSLGDALYGRELAEAAADEAGKSLPPSVFSKLLVIRARASARLGDRTDAERLISQATEYDASDNGTIGDQGWRPSVSYAYLAGQMAHCYLDLGLPSAAEAFAAEACADYPTEQVRRRVMGACLLATCHVASGNVERAAAVGTEALELAGSLRSSRSTKWIRRVEGALLVHRKETSVREFLDQSAQLPSN